LFPLKATKLQKKKKQTKHPQEGKKRKETLRGRFIKNKRLLNPTHISLEKDKQPKTKTTRRIVMMSQSNDDGEREILLKR
jgi:hypothetical protein